MELVVDSKWVQGFPPLMPRQVEVKVELAQVAEVRQAAAGGALYVRLDTPDGERLQVKDLWFNPHDQTRITCILSD
ncbi:MAG: hypothetical protein M0Z66_14195 [Thermaerobacter sp.]|nr:hypothetical protein [Thermaerobacter sp.]